MAPLVPQAIETGYAGHRFEHGEKPDVISWCAGEQHPLRLP